MPPTIPTSFVPHPAKSASTPGGASALTNALAAFAFFVFLLAVLSAAAVFIYGSILSSEKASKDAALTKAEASLNQGTIEQFVRLRDRLTSSETLLNSHVALSGLFDLLQSVTPQDADFSSLQITTDSQGNTTLVANGTAKSFNALAAASNDFAADARLKNAIFSNLAIAPSGSVSFILSATLDPTLIAYTGTEAPPPAPSVAPIATTTPVAATTTKP